MNLVTYTRDTARVGDIAMFRSGSPAMTVVHVDYDAAVVTLVWTLADGRLQTLASMPMAGLYAVVGINLPDEIAVQKPYNSEKLQ